MLIELYDFGVETRLLHVLAGLALGLIFGVAAQITRFCLRRAVAGATNERASAGAVWATALVTAIIAFWGAQAAGFISLEGHRYLSADLPLVALIVGGLAFGIGMVLTRGCVSRLTVLSATGNLRAATVLLTFAVVAHATLKGALAPVRTMLTEPTMTAPIGTLAERPVLLALLLIAGLGLAVGLVRTARPSFATLALGALIGGVAVAGWIVTSMLLMDEFEPLPVQSAAFTLPWSDGLFWFIAATSIPAGFGVGWVAGVLGGSFLSASLRRELSWQSFSSAGETLRYVGGGALMGIGGVLAGGCTIGAGLSGIATGSIAALIALLAIITGGVLASRLPGIAPQAQPVAA